MKIDDYISLCRDMSKDLRDMAKRTNNARIKEDADDWDEMADMFEELKWYRSQDLIRREEATKAVDDAFDLYFCSTDDEDVTEEIMRIPKAEYGGNDYETTIL